MFEIGYVGRAVLVIVLLEAPVLKAELLLRLELVTVILEIPEEAETIVPLLLDVIDDDAVMIVLPVVVIGLVTVVVWTLVVVVYAVVGYGQPTAYGSAIQSRWLTSLGEFMKAVAIAAEKATRAAEYFMLKMDG